MIQVNHNQEIQTGRLPRLLVKPKFFVSHEEADDEEDLELEGEDLDEEDLDDEGDDGSDDDDDNDTEPTDLDTVELLKENRRLERELRKTRKEAARRRVALKNATKSKDGEGDQEEDPRLLELQQQNEELQAEIAHNKFLEGARSIANTFNFHNTAQALRLADLEEAEEEEDPKERRKLIRRALKDLAATSPFLVKKVTKPDLNSGGGGNSKKTEKELAQMDADIRIEYGI